MYFPLKIKDLGLTYPRNRDIERERVPVPEYPQKRVYKGRKERKLLIYIGFIIPFNLPYCYPIPTLSLPCTKLRSKCYVL